MSERNNFSVLPIGNGAVRNKDLKMKDKCQLGDCSARRITGKRYCINHQDIYERRLMVLGCMAAVLAFLALLTWLSGL